MHRFPRNLNEMTAEPNVNEFRNALKANAASYGASLTAEDIAALAKYYQLLTAWNPRLHLVAPVAASEFATRHVLESLVLLNELPTVARIADIGSGGGLPIIPCLIVRPDLRAVLIEASPKKTVFLREALREVLSQPPGSEEPARIIADRFEDISPPAVDFVTCRALERFEETIPRLLKWAPENASLLLFGGEGLGKRIAAAGGVARSILLPNSEQRFLFVVDAKSRADD
jgi:16S rRNA (guanine527-N7)-methyltransferase